VNKKIAILGFYASAAASVAAAGYGVAQLLQIVGLINYPWDDILIFGFSLCIAPPFLLSMLAVHYTAPMDRRIWSHAALLFGTMYVVYVVLMYVVQLAVVIPAPVRDNSIGVLRVSPHSFFWTLDGLGYICMGVSTLFAAFVFSNEGLQKWVRRFLIANGFLTPVIAFIYFYPHFSIALLLVGTPWIIVVPGSLFLLALVFRGRIREARVKMTGLFIFLFAAAIAFPIDSL
jgi:hypothetical protein